MVQVPHRGSSREQDLPFWILEQLYTVEAEPPVETHDSFVLVHRARLLRRVTAWNRASAHAFSAECAWQVRDRLAETLSRSARRNAVDSLTTCTDLTDLGWVAGEIGAQVDGDLARLAGYAADLASFALKAGAESGWAAAAATCGFVAATATRSAAGTAASEAERTRQARWLAGLAGSEAEQSSDSEDL